MKAVDGGQRNQDSEETGDRNEIVGGEEVEPHSMPWQVSLVSKAQWFKFEFVELFLSVTQSLSSFQGMRRRRPVSTKARTSLFSQG